MRAVKIAFTATAASGAVAGVNAITASECSNQWTTACDSLGDSFNVDPKLQLLPECNSHEDCIENGLTKCGKTGLSSRTNDDGSLNQVWLVDSTGDLQPGIDNLMFRQKGDPVNTCGTDAQVQAWMDPAKKVSVYTGCCAQGSKTKNTALGLPDDYPEVRPDGVASCVEEQTCMDLHEYTGCYAQGSKEKNLEMGLPADYPVVRPTGVESCVQGTVGKPTCRCTTKPRSGSETKSDCKKLSDDAQTSSYLASRFRAFKNTVHQCQHYEAPQCASDDFCRWAGPNVKKQCTSVSPCTTNFMPESFVNEEDNVFNSNRTPGESDERCTCTITQCDSNWADHAAKKKAADEQDGEDNGTDKTAKTAFSLIDTEMKRLQTAGQCVIPEEVVQKSEKEYSMHIGLIAAIAAGAVSFAALVTGALICILMYACRSESHVEAQARNQAARNPYLQQPQPQPYGQPNVYGRAGHEMEMSRRSRY